MKMHFATIPGSALKVRSRESYYARQTRLFVLVVILVPLIPLLFISWTASHFYQKSWMAKTTIELTSLANSRREIIDLFLDSQENSLAGYAELYDLAWLSTPGNLEKLFQAMNRQGVIVDLGLITKDGNHRNYVGPFRGPEGQKLRRGPLVLEVMQSGRYISDVFSGYRGVPISSWR